MRNLVWFRRDLRVRDQWALAEACRDPEAEVVAVYVATPRQWKQHDDAPCKVAFWLANLKELSGALKQINVKLRFEETEDYSGVPTALLRVAREFKCETLYFNREYEVNERRRDRAVTSAFENAGLAVHAFDDRAILPPGSVLNKSDKPYTVFTPFRKRWLELALSRLENVPPRIRRRRPIRISASPIPQRIGGFGAAADALTHWRAGEVAAYTRLEIFAERNRSLERYHKWRDFPGEFGTSWLSPYLAAGVISARACLRWAMDSNGRRLDGSKKGPTTWITELIWRDFYIHVLAAFPRVSMGQPFNVRTKRIAWRDDPKSFQAWVEGRTGYPLVDAGMRQLRATGWMHNRLRMVTAMFLSKHLLIDWRLGEAHFMQHLIDGDLAANNGGWQWSASTGTDAVPYFRVFNPSSQGRRFDPNGVFIKQFIPELASVPSRDIHDPKTLGKHDLGCLGYPPPICDHATARRRAIEAFARIRR